MNDKARLKFLDRLARSNDLTVSEASFIESLGDADTLNDRQRQRADDLHSRYKEKSDARKPTLKRDKPVPFLRDSDTEAKLNPCRAGHRPVAGRFAEPPDAPWKCWCLCISVTHDSAETMIAIWNRHHPSPPQATLPEDLTASKP